MAFTELPVQIITFVVFLIIAGGFSYIIMYGNTETLASQQNEFEQTIQTAKSNMQLDVATYNAPTFTTTLYVRNSGTIRLNTSELTIIIDDAFYTGTNSQVNTTILNDTVVVNDEWWDPQEMISITVQDILDPGTHAATVRNYYEVSTTRSFTS